MKSAQSNYDAWGNVTSRTSNGTTATLSYDKLDHMVEYSNNSANTQVILTQFGRA